jgi:putative ABC transport system permease protein
MTIIGVMIGVGAVILVNTIMDGFNEYVESSIDKIGSNVLYISKWEDGVDFDNLTEEQRRRKNITMDEAIAIRDMCPLVKAVSPEKRSFNNVIKYNERQIRTPDDFRGCWPEQIVVANREVEHGRFIDDNDMRRSAMVCVIGPDVCDALFDDRAEALDKKIRINGYQFRVIGVQERVEDLLGISENDFVFIPMSTFDRLYPKTERVYLLVSAVSRELIGEAADQVTNALRRVRGVRPEEPNNFGINTQQMLKDEISSITVKVQLGVTAVACVGLLVGVIGVMNIMLVAVTQRTREIGIRKAVGARRANILFQFLVEAATLAGLGGVVGIVVGALVGLAITSILDWTYSLSFFWIHYE